MDDKNLTPLSELGEFSLIAELPAWAGDYGKSPNLEVGIGDDCAVIEKNDKEFELVTKDLLTEGVHFDLAYTPLMHLGYKSVVVNLSDIYAMNGKAEYIVVGLAMSSKFTYEAVRELYTGIVTACRQYGVTLIGGDTTTSKSGLTISITAMGSVEKTKLCRRKGAKDKELLVVTGDLGAAYMGLQLLEREKRVFKDAPTTQPDLEGNDYVLERQLKPEARKDIVALLDQLEVTPTSMIDVSDGLASEIMHLSKASDVGIMIYDEKIPVDPTTHNLAREFNLDPSTTALNGGEDYELLFTIKQEDYDKIKGNPNLTVIGHAQEKSRGCEYTDHQNGVHPLVAQGWDSFKD